MAEDITAKLNIVMHLNTCHSSSPLPIYLPIVHDFFEFAGILIFYAFKKNK